MQGQAVLDVAEAVRADCGTLLNVYRMQFAFDAAPPELEEPLELGEIGRQIELLPNEALQESRVVGQMVDDLRGGETVTTELQL